ncbi:MAG: nitroreductase family deazaflavin-dependent oxidoreductase [Microthrixaceae bacterium]
MPIEGDYEPSPWEPVAEQVELYERTDGEEGYEFAGGPCIILTTKGAKSGKLRKTPLIRVTDGTNYLVVGSMGGAPQNPNWVHNLRADPRARLRDKAEVRDYTVRELEGEEKQQWWERATGVWPDYDEYQASTERIIPVFLLEPA